MHVIALVYMFYAQAVSSHRVHIHISSEGFCTVYIRMYTSPIYIYAQIKPILESILCMHTILGNTEMVQ